MEVSNCQQRPCDREFLADLARQYELLASVGSDFHSAQPWRDLGFNIDLPARVHPVWEDARAAPYRFAVS